MDIFIYNNALTDSFKFPVVPEQISIDSPQQIESFNSLSLGELKLIGLKGTRKLGLSSFFPTKDYPFLRDKSLKGMDYVNKIELWREEKKPLHIVIPDLNINFTCVIASFSYSIQDGSGDIYYSIDIDEYKIPTIKKITPDKKYTTAPSKTTTSLPSSYGIVTASTLNVRSGAGKGYKDIGDAAQGAKIKLVRLVGAWWQVNINGKTGYVSSDYIRRA